MSRRHRGNGGKRQGKPKGPGRQKPQAAGSRRRELRDRRDHAVRAQQRRGTPRDERRRRDRADKERKRKLAVICDFDGTVTTVDIAEAILKKFTGDGWYQFEKDYRAGKLASREALKRQFTLVKANKGQIIGAALDSAKITPGFEDFVRYCQSRGIPFVVLSEGLDFYIERILASTGVDVEWHSNMGRFKENGLDVEFLDNVEECNSCGNCKLGRLKAMQRRGWEIVYIGDGHSDLCPAQEADHVLAKGALLAELRRRNVRCTKFNDFRDCARYLEGLK